ncbi:MAG: hypothetical protein KC503_26055 [Myxococcales bacterium]|nr:hypothetical protein [Myxococcales bacterium]
MSRWVSMMLLLALASCRERAEVPETTASFGGSGTPEYAAAAPTKRLAKSPTSLPVAAAGSVIGRSTDPQLPQHAAGPARSASAAQLSEARARAQRLTRSLLKGGIARREVTSVADIHGSTLYMKRRYAEALAWYQVGMAIDPSFEPILYNAARAAALLGKHGLARQYLHKLATLGTPLGRRRLARARRDPDLSSLRIR